jgi:hypothetical protein
MKKLLKVIWGIFAVIGILTVAGLLILRISNCEIDINPSFEKGFDKYLKLLRKSGPYVKDADSFEMKIIQDTARAKEIRDYFHLETLYEADADTWTKALAIGKFVASNIPHDNQAEYPEHVNAIGLWEYTRDVAPAFNCRLHSILSFELMLAAGLDARYVTCLPEDENDSDCHVVNEVWLPEMGKWAMIDTDSGGYYYSDGNGVPLSLKEIRDRYISGEEMILYPRFKESGKNNVDHLAYMAKNTYWFNCWENLSYYQEDANDRKRAQGLSVSLVPSGFEPFYYQDNSIITSDADIFWAPPKGR